MEKDGWDASTLFTRRTLGSWQRPARAPAAAGTHLRSLMYGHATAVWVRGPLLAKSASVGVRHG